MRISARWISMPFSRMAYSPGLSCRLSRMCTGGTTKPISCASCRAQRSDALDQLAALTGVDQRHQLVADLELEQIERRRHVRLLLLRRVGARLDAPPAPSACALCSRPAYDSPPSAPGERHERQERQPGQQRQRAEDHRHHREHARVQQHLRRHLAAEVGARCGARHHDARRGRDQQRRHLRHQAVADGQDRVDLGRALDVEPALHHADEEPADDVDAGDHDAGDGVAADELAGAVHGAVEVGLGLDRSAGARAPRAR